MNGEIKHSTAIQKEIWRQAIDATKHGDYSTVQALVVPAIDRMVDIATIQTVAFQSHPPGAVWGMLGSYFTRILCACRLQHVRLQCPKLGAHPRVRSLI